MIGKEDIKELLTFTKGEKNGLLVLLLILGAVIAFRVVVNSYSFADKSNLDTAQLALQVDSFRTLLKKKEDPEYISRLDQYIIERYDSLDLFRFNPNTATAEDWKKLGLSDKQIGNILNFTSKGGKFYDKNDFRRMYGIRTRQYLILEPYIDLPERSGPSSYGNFGSYYSQNFENNEPKPFKPDSLFTFDPNTADTETLEALGLTYRQASAVINYRKSGGEFQKKSDFKKIYTIEEEQYQWLKDYIDLPQTGDTEETTDEPTRLTKVDINSATEDEFKTMNNNFWKFNASGIVKYRELLGGYIHSEQLLEVYGVKEKFYNYIKDDIAPIRQEPKKLRINFASAWELGRHPYIASYDAEAIVEFRDKNGPFSRISDIRKHKLVSQTTYDKLKHYITVE